MDASCTETVIYLYLVSAAHAIVDLTYGDEYSIQWSSVSVHHQSSDLFRQVEFDRIYIPEEYVKQGSSDVGIARIKVPSVENLVNQTERVITSDGKLVGKTVVGHGRVFLRGSVLSYPNENRIMIDTPSLSGCSGCPLFDGNKRLAAFVHGGVKHRGGVVLHNNGNDDVTGYLFADSIADVSFLAVDSAFFELLRIAEDIECDLASNPTDETAYSKFASEALQKATDNDARTLEQAMTQLHDKIWSADAERDIIKVDGHLELLSNKDSY